MSESYKWLGFLARQLYIPVDIAEVSALALQVHRKFTVHSI